MASVVLQNVTKQFGPQVVLENLSLEVRTGETVGLVGANGAGKTTLFRLITRDQAPDMGTVTRSRGLEVGFLPQEPQLDTERTLHDEVGRAFDELLALERKLLEHSERMSAEHGSDRLGELMARYDKLSAQFEAAGGYGFQTRLNEILGGLGFSTQDYRLPVSALSGGQKCRAALAQVLLQDRQLLLLDEPTNHLDIDGTQWLEKFLAGHHGGAVIISHDRYLLDRLVTKIIELADRRVTVYPGNYSNYVQAREIRRLTRQRQHEKDRQFVEKERAFIAKHIARQRGKEARGRRTRLERRIEAGEFVLDRPRQEKTTAFKFTRTTAPSGKPVLWAEGVSKRYDAKVLFEGLDLRLMPGERLGITGPNGTGKTTLLRMIMMQVAADQGTIVLGAGLRVGYYEQDHARPDPDRSLLEEVGQARPDLGETQVRSFLGRFLFTGGEVFKPIEALSGGEQSRMRLAKLVLSEPQVLILDEPTNHLDIPSREVLETALDAFDGTVIVVSHDRYFLDRVVGRLLVLERNGHGLHSGNYSYYVQQLEAERRAEEDAQTGGRPARLRRRRRQAAGRTSRVSGPYDSLTLEQVEERILAKERDLAAIHERFGDQSVYRSANAARQLEEELGAVARELGELNRAWEERVDDSET